MTRRIFNAICTTFLAVFGLFFIVLIFIAYNYIADIHSGNLDDAMDTFVSYYENYGLKSLDKLKLSDIRLSVIDAEGDVIYDSSDIALESMDNHLDREEVREALQFGEGASSRYSDTLTELSLYRTRRIEDGYILRLSVTRPSLLSIVSGLLRELALFILIILILAMFLANFLSKSIVEPLNSLDLDYPLKNVDYDEIAPLLKRIDMNQKQLGIKEESLKRSREELDVIVNSMNEGMVLLGSKFEIININKVARELLNASDNCRGKDILSISRHIKLQEAIKRVAEGEELSINIDFSQGVYKLDAYALRDCNGLRAIVLIFFDIGEREKIERLRREFTANVSHELKTPLHSISGYAELLKHGMVKNTDAEEFGYKIYTEAARMKQLIDDIIRLSRLDETAGEPVKQEIDVYELAKEIMESHKLKAKELDISLSLFKDSDDTRKQLVPELTSLIINNLLENAIKYNKECGDVIIRIRAISDKIEIVVEDNGIGIAEEDKERIFERFYRVDKSRSKSVGGTGLGLSIVKHAVKVQGGSIEMESKPGKGTKVKVVL